MTAPSPAPSTSVCPVCGAAAIGKFCSACGAALGGPTCAACHAELSPGAKFCHRCGTKVGATPLAANNPDAKGLGAALPWTVAAIALVALIALIAGQRFNRNNSSAPSAADGGAPAAPAPGSGPRAVDISQMTPEERADRLFDRVMRLAESGRVDSVQIFAPMAITAYEMLGNLTSDQRYDLGRIAQVAGDAQVAKAQADTILASNPNHLLGLVLAASAARMNRDAAKERQYLTRLAAAAPAERAKALPEYGMHANDIDAALKLAAAPSAR